MAGENQPGPAAPAPGATDSAAAGAAAAQAPAEGSAAPAAPAPGAAAALPPAAAAAAPEPAPAPAADAPKTGADAAKPAADAAAKPTNEFKPSLLDVAAAEKKEGGDAAKTDAKPADAKAGDAKPGETAKPEPGKDGTAAAEPPAPIEYAFTYPEGVSADSVNAERMGAFTGLLNEARVKPEGAQKLLDLHLAEVGEVAKNLAQKQWDVFNAQQNRWREDVMADAVLGGARHNTAMKEIMSFVDQYAGDAAERQALLEDLRLTGIANSPRFLRLLQRASLDLTREAAPHPAPPPRAAAPTGQQRGLNRYAKTTPAR